MASAYFKLKILQQRRFVENLSKTEKLLQPNNLKTNYLIPPDTVHKCRVCLERGTKPIYGSPTLPDISASLQLFGGIKIKKTDSFSKYVCECCYSFLQFAVTFREKALKSDLMMQQGLLDNGIKESISENIGSVNKESQDLGKKLFSCKTCKQSFHSLSTYTQHKNSKEHRSIRVQCPICYGLLTPHLFKKHLARHKTTSHLVCHICGKLYRKDNLVRHLQLHSFVLPYHCKLCPYRGRFMESLKLHMRTHTGNKPFSCDKCQLCFLTRSNLNRHLLTHKKNKPLKCIECARGFYLKHDMELHFKSDHAGIKDFACRICENRFGTRKALLRHEIRAHKRSKMAKGRLPLYLQAEYKT
ncbi:unnamed protein product [Parnassius mnemosyne]|uniref:Uncharacterized protein n=1 Tax=Parnassius mnemosyne TaxID=213953 RepID=A0AAV1LHX3_9NEOP